MGIEEGSVKSNLTSKQQRILATMQSPFWRFFWLGPWFVGTAHCHVWWTLHGICSEHPNHEVHQLLAPWCRCGSFQP